ncbi:MAG TPA: LCP family protein [Acidimicrobiia bacterium]|nr:LCP family protein [Acidimicrobiia bacterium]
MSHNPATTTPSRRAPQQTRRRRFSRGQRWTIGILLFLVLAATALIGATFLADFQMEDAGPMPSLAAGDGVYLIVGSDSRENLPDDLDQRFFGDFGGARADVIILAQVVDGRRQLLSLPRDLLVEIPGHGGDKINAAYAFGGPDLLAETVADATGIRPNHYLEVEFAGFAGIIDALGGIELDIPYPARDDKSGLVLEPGVQKVNGATALAYARSRSYEEYREGQWVPQGGGDIARAARQREVLTKMMAGASSPSGLVRSPLVVTAIGSHLTADSGLTVFDLARTGWDMRSADVTESMTLPVVGAEEGGISYLVRDDPAATEVLNAFATGQPLPGA